MTTKSLRGFNFLGLTKSLKQPKLAQPQAAMMMEVTVVRPRRQTR